MYIVDASLMTFCSCNNVDLSIDLVFGLLSTEPPLI